MEFLHEVVLGSKYLQEGVLVQLSSVKVVDVIIGPS